MEFPFDINTLFSERVSILDQTLVAGRKSAGRPDLQAHIATVIDELGRASAKAQQLTAPITSASKLQSQRHQLYLLKDAESNGGRGVVVGFLKVGYKKLFLLDLQGVHIETEPLCVLDFYIAENLQRHGYGQELFDFMLQHKNLEPVLMAYDRPSPKFLSFLAKHYCLTRSVPQVNNFVVFEGFFLNRSALSPFLYLDMVCEKTTTIKVMWVGCSAHMDMFCSDFVAKAFINAVADGGKAAQLRKVPLKKLDGEIKPYSLMEREVVRQEQRVLPWPFAPPHSPQRLVSSQYSHSLSVGSSPSRAPPRVAPVSAPGGNRDQSPQSPLIDRCRARRTSQQGLVARCSLYSRHLDCRAVGLQDRHLPGLRPVGDQSYAVGYTGTHRLASIHTPQSRSRPLSLPPLSTSKKSVVCSQSSLDGTETHPDTDAEACGAVEEIMGMGGLQRPAGDLQGHLSEKESDRSSQGWSWTVGENCYTAQWVKQKQEYRSTRPW